MNLFIAISGCGGGNKGPQGIFQKMEETRTDSDTTFLPHDTTPNDIDKNVQQVVEIAQKSLEAYQNIYLIGHSMGGAVAAIAARQLNQSNKGAVKGVVLLSTQTEGVLALKGLGLPVLFYHGERDKVFPVWQIKGIFERLAGPKKMVVINQLDHDMSLKKKALRPRRFSRSLAEDLYTEIAGFLLKERSEDTDVEGECVTKNIHWALKKRPQCLSPLIEDNGK